jgi:hypothetical protein
MMPGAWLVHRPATLRVNIHDHRDRHCAFCDGKIIAHQVNPIAATKANNLVYDQSCER